MEPTAGNHPRRSNLPSKSALQSTGNEINLALLASREEEDMQATALDETMQPGFGEEEVIPKPPDVRHRISEKRPPREGEGRLGDEDLDNILTRN